MTEKTVDAMGIDISWAVVMNYQNPPVIAREKERGGQTRWPSANYYAIIAMIVHTLRKPAETTAYDSFRQKQELRFNPTKSQVHLFEVLVD